MICITEIEYTVFCINKPRRDLVRNLTKGCKNGIQTYAKSSFHSNMVECFTIILITGLLY